MSFIYSLAIVTLIQYAANAQLSLFLRSAHGVHAVSLPVDATVAAVEQQVRRLNGYAPHLSLILTFGGHPLHEPCAELADLGIHSEATIDYQLEPLYTFKHNNKYLRESGGFVDCKGETAAHINTQWKIVALVSPNDVNDHSQFACDLINVATGNKLQVGTFAVSRSFFVTVDQETQEIITVSLSAHKKNDVKVEENGDLALTDRAQWTEFIIRTVGGAPVALEQWLDIWKRQFGDEYVERNYFKRRFIMRDMQREEREQKEREEDLARYGPVQHPSDRCYYVAATGGNGDEFPMQGVVVQGPDRRRYTCVCNPTRTAYPRYNCFWERVEGEGAAAAGAVDRRLDANIFVLQDFVSRGFLRQQGGNANVVGMDIDESDNCVQWRFHFIPQGHPYYARIARGTRRRDCDDDCIYFKLQNVANGRYLRFHDNGNAVDVNGGTKEWTDLIGYLNADESELFIQIESGYFSDIGDTKFVGVLQRELVKVDADADICAKFMIRRPNTNTTVPLAQFKQLSVAI